MNSNGDQTVEQRQLLARMRKLNAKHRKAVANEEALRAKRLDLYQAGRQLLPPLTWDEIADAFGISGAAVQQAVMKSENPKPPGKPGRPRGSVKAKATA